MVFHARKWGWKRLAANLLLVPVLTGGSAAVAHAQFDPANPGPGRTPNGFPTTATPAMPAMPRAPTAPATTASPAKPGAMPAMPGGPPAAPRTAGPAQIPAGDAKTLLKEGRKALAAGQFDRAQDLARAAEANNPTGKWGLFEDTPHSLIKDVQAAVTKVQKAQADQLMKDAKALLARPAAGDAERAANLDKALQMAHRADQLHGPYSAWEFGDRPDKLMKEIQATRARLRANPTPAAPPGGVVAAGGTTTPPNQPVKPAGGPVAPPANPGSTAVAGNRPTGPAAPALDPRKNAALKLMAEGRKLADQGEFRAARAKFVEADKVGAVFAPNEASPGFALQDLNARGVAAMDRLLNEARGHTAKKDFGKADAALNGASEIALALGLFPRPVEEAKAQLRAASGGKHGTTTIAGMVATGGPEYLVPAGPTGPKPPAAPAVAAKPPVQPGPANPTGPAAPTSPAVAVKPPAPTGPVAPVSPPNPVPPTNPAVAVQPPTPTLPVPTPPMNPPGTAVVTAPATPAAPVVPASGGVTGRQLLEQAAYEFTRGELDTAARLATQAHNLGGVQDEARGLLNSIDAERLAQKKITAGRSFEAAHAAFKNKDYNHAFGVLVLIDTKLLTDEQAGKHRELVAACKAELDRPAAGAAVATAGGTQGSDFPALPPAVPLPGPDGPPAAAPGANPPGSARVGADPKPGGADDLTNQVEALRRVQFQKLRADGLKIQTDAQAAFGRGETDLAIQMLVDYANRVRAANIEPAGVALLLRPIDSRLEMFRVMKGQTDALARQNKETREARDQIVGRGAAEEQRKAEVASLVRKYHALVGKSEFAEAEKVAMQAKQLDPDNPAIGALAHMAKIQKRVREAEKIKSDREQFVLDGLNKAETYGRALDIDDPVSIRLASMHRAHRRGSANDLHIRTRTPAEYDIELKLDRPIPVEFTQTPLDLAIDNLRTITGLPISVDTAAIESEGISLQKPISEKLGSVATRHVLAIILEKAGLSYVVENDVVKVTTTKKAKGRLFTKVFSVADLVTPVPNFALPDYANFEKMLSQTALSTGRLNLQGNGGTPTLPQGGLGGGTPLPGTLATTPGISGGLPLGPGGTLQSSGPGANSGRLPWAVSTTDRQTKHDQLIKLITGMVRPYSWDGMGGAGRLEYFDIGSALVVNQTADVIREIEDLLEALRRLQDLAIAIEVRIVSLSETWFERLGVDFSMNIKTHTASFEPALTNGTFRPTPYINDINAKGVTVGLTPAGSFTPDLDVPIRPKNFERAVPPFGGYPNMPGDNGGISLGLAFLNDIQVYMFMEAAQGDRRVNVMHAPKLTMFNGQTSTLAINQLDFYVTNVSVTSVNGQLVFTPQNTPLPGPGAGNFNIALQAVVSADRRFVRINQDVTLSAQTGATVPLFPITTFITPVFEGGSQGQPIPFTQFLQQPSFTTMTFQTTVVCPDGGTVLLGGLKSLSEGRNEFGPPFLSKIPYLNRLFKNVGIGRETQHIMIMVTPRIIINAEEEIFQTEGRQPTTQP